MRAAWFDDFGPAAKVLHVGEQVTPVPGDGEVLVGLRASGVNPSDVKKRTGAFPELLEDGFIIPNSDGAGIIEAVGHGVDASRLGERVWVYQAQFGRRFGTAAEFVAVDSRRAPRLPDNASFEVGASLGIPAMTAHRAVFADGAVAGRTILVTGGSGRVGHYAVQWASQAGADVIATASNADDAASCKAAGASHVVNHRDDDLAGQIMAKTHGQRLDRVVDVEFGATLPTSVEVLKVGGTIATYGSALIPEPTLPFYGMMYKDLAVRFVIVYAMPEEAKERAVADIEAALTRDRLIHRIANRLPLDDIATANEIVEAGKCRGSVILAVPPPTGPSRTS